MIYCWFIKKHIGLWSGLLWWLLVIPAAGAQPLSPSGLAEFRELYQRRNWKPLILGLEPLKHSSELSPQTRARIRFWLGNSYLNLEQYSLAEAEFQAGLQEFSDDTDFWQYHTLRVYLRSGQQAKAVPLMLSLMQPPLNQFYLGKIRANLKAFFNTPETAVLAYPLFQKTLKQTSLLLADHDLIAIYLQGMQAQALPIPDWVYKRQWFHPNSRQTAMESELRIVNLRQENSKFLQDEDYWKRFLALYDLKLYHTILDTLPGHLPYVQTREVRGKLGEIYLYVLFAQQQYDEILNLRQQNTLTEDFYVEETTQLYWVERAYLRLQKWDQAAQAVRDLEAFHPQSSWLARAYWRLAQGYELAERPEARRLWQKRLVERFPLSREAEKAIWDLTWDRFLNQEYTEAQAYIQQALQLPLSSPEVEAKFLYWQGKIQLLQKEKISATQTLQTLLNQWPNTYYSLRLLHEGGTLAALAKTPRNFKTPSFWHEHPPALPPELGSLMERVNFLFDVGEDSHALSELTHKARQLKSPALLWKTGELMYRYQQYEELQKWIGAYFLRDLKAMTIKGQALWKQAYPLVFWSEVQKHSASSGIDPYWVMATIREESRFNPEAISSAQARGLMQLMTPTGKQVAQKQGLKLQQPQELFTPALNIRLGTYYLASLAKQYNQQLVYASGSYNAGPGNMRKWLKQWGDRPIDEFVETIPFDETQNYVKRVFTSYQLYRKIYSSP